MVTLFLRQGENGKQVLLSFPATTPAEKADVAATMESLKSMSKTVTIQGAASEVMNLGLYLSGVDLAAEGELERINQLADRLEHMSEVDCDKFAGMLDANSICISPQEAIPARSIARSSLIRLAGSCTHSCFFGSSSPVARSFSSRMQFSAIQIGGRCLRS